MSAADQRSHRPPGRRARRLRWTIGLLTAAGLAGAALAVWLFLATRPEPYRPGERLRDITRSLDRNLPEDAPVPRFVDATGEAGLESFRSFAGERSSQLPEDMGSGAAWGDFDADGDDDLFLVSAGGSLQEPPSRWGASELYENLGDGRFRRFDRFPETRIIGMAAAWADFDADGRLDLVVSGYNALRLYRNEGDRFVRDERLAEPEGFWSGATWGDFDNDRDLDLYVCGYVRYVENEAGRAQVSLQYGRSVPYTLNPVSYRPERNLLFRNDGGSFTEIAAALGVDNPEGRSLGALWHDFDRDGWLDLYVANDISDNVFFRNRAGRFENISHAAWVADYRGAMGMAAGDWNRDGDDDLFITHWVAQENALYDSRLSDGDPAPAGPPLRFIDVADRLGLGQIALPRVGWGTEFADFDGDGWLDLVVANGSTFEQRGENSRLLQPQPSFFFWNGRGEHFYDLAGESELLAAPHVGRGLALADYDNDGDVDIVRVLHGEGAQLLRNEMQAGNWIEFRLRGRDPANPAALLSGEGTDLVARVGDTVLRRSVNGPSYLSQSSRRIHLGLGDATAVDSVEVGWHAGETQVWSGLEAGSIWELSEGDPEPRRIATPRPADAGTTAEAGPEDEKEAVLRFWEKQRAAMNAIKVDGDCKAAIGLFREALALRPDHEDSLYYLANCLVEGGEVDGALEQFEKLVAVNPVSHRGWKQIGILHAQAAGGRADLPPAEAALERAVEINPEETGALLALGEIALLRGDLPTAAERLAHATRTNPRATGGLFLLGYIAWKEGDSGRAAALLGAARETLGEDWKPEGTTSEGDVQRRMHTEPTPLHRFWQEWNGATEPGVVFPPLNRFLDRFDRLARTDSGNDR